jgi:hypothetical protein
MLIGRAESRQGRTKLTRTKVGWGSSKALLLILALAPLAAISGCSALVSAQNAKTQTSFQLTPATLNFGSIAMGKKTSQTATVTNTGNTPITITQESVSNSQFGVSGVSFPLSLAVGQGTNFSVWFNGTAAGKSTATLTVQANGGTPPAVVTLTGTALAPQAQLSLGATSVDFGSVTVGSKGSSTVTLSNTGAADLTVSVLTVNGAPFGISGITTPKAISAGQSAVMTVTFSPVAAGAANGSIVITSNDANSPAIIALSGLGTNAAVSHLTVSPASINFGSVVDGSSKPQQVTVTNTGSASLTIVQGNLSGTGFSVSGLFTPLTLGAGQGSTFNVQFAPQSAGNLSGSLSLVSNAPNSPTVISLSGTGVAATVNVVTNPSSISFGSVKAGTSSTQSVIVSNSGNTSVTISQINVAAKDVAVSGVTTPITLLPTQSVAMNVKFSPTTAESVNGNLTLVNTQGSSTNVNVTGNGVQPGLNITPATIGFGNVVAGSTNSQTVQISNTGNANLTISQANVIGSDFSTSGLSVPLVLSAGQGKTFNVQFAPQATGNVSGSISLVSDAPSSPNAVALSGNGIAATFTLSLSSSNLSFGNVNTSSATSQNVTITNTGNSKVTISQINVSGSGFSLSGAGTPVTLSPSQSLTVTVQFSPLVVGSTNGSLTIASNASGSPASVSLSGTGVQQVQHSVALNWNASTSTVSGYNVYRSAISGSGYAKMNTSLVGSLNYTDSTVQSAQTYYYVTTAVDARGAESIYSNEAGAIIP